MLLGLVVALLVAGCGGSSTPERVTVTETATPAAAPTTTVGHGGINDQDRVFLSTLQGSSDGAYFADVPRDQLFDTAHTICTKMDTDGKIATLKSLLDVGLTLGRATALLFASVTAYCPQHLTGIQ
jgi:hypothetical protein